MTIAPDLIIFDIDATLLDPSIVYDGSETVRRGLYDDKLLTLFLTNPLYQVGLASFNHDFYPRMGILGGRRLGRAILDIQHPTGNSRAIVEDSFIQAWRFESWDGMNLHKKDEHIKLIVFAYKEKYGCSPPSILFYDDCIENVYEASRMGVKSYWVRDGLTRNNITAVEQIKYRVYFTTNSIAFDSCIDETEFRKYIRKLFAMDVEVFYSIYLPIDGLRMYMRLKRLFNTYGIEIKILNSDLQ